MSTGEVWLLERLVTFGADVYEGEFDTMRDRLAHAIMTHRLESVIAGKRDGKAATYADAFELLYGIKPKNVSRTTKPQEGGA